MQPAAPPMFWPGFPRWMLKRRPLLTIVQEWNNGMEQCRNNGTMNGTMGSEQWGQAWLIAYKVCLSPESNRIKVASSTWRVILSLPYS